VWLTVNGKSVPNIADKNILFQFKTIVWFQVIEILNNLEKLK